MDEGGEKASVYTHTRTQKPRLWFLFIYVLLILLQLFHSPRPWFTGAVHPRLATSGQRPNSVCIRPSLTPTTRRPVCVCVCVFALMPSCLPSLGHHHTIHRRLIPGRLKEGDQQRHRIHPCRLRCVLRGGRFDRNLRCPPNRYLSKRRGRYT